MCSSDLKAGNIDAYPDYTGTLASEILKLPGRATLQQINAALAPMGLGAAIPLGFENTYAIAVSDARAGNLRTLADLAHQPGLRLGLSHEFIGRVDGWPALVRAYGLPQKPVGIDHGLAYEALHDGQIDGTDIYSTDAKIHKFHLRVLEDNLHVFPGYEAVVVYRLDVPRRFPAAWQAMQQLAGRITVTDMIDMNAEAELGGKSFAAIARSFSHCPRKSSINRSDFLSFSRRSTSVRRVFASRNLPFAASSASCASGIEFQRKYDNRFAIAKSSSFASGSTW